MFTNFANYDPARRLDNLRGSVAIVVALGNDVNAIIFSTGNVNFFGADYETKSIQAPPPTFFQRFDFGLLIGTSMFQRHGSNSERPHLPASLVGVGLPASCDVVYLRIRHDVLGFPRVDPAIRLAKSDVLDAADPPLRLSKPWPRVKQQRTQAGVVMTMIDGRPPTGSSAGRGRASWLPIMEILSPPFRKYGAANRSVLDAPILDTTQTLRNHSPS